MVRISFLLPCYKVEKYIQACLDSIYKVDIPTEEFEVLCFNDCSPDSTAEIIGENMKRHPNLQLYNAQENVGCGGGRNVLQRIAKGRFVWFIDPDDMIIPDVVTPMLEQAEANDLDVLLFNYCDMNENGDVITQGTDFRDTKVLDGLSLTEHVFGHNIVMHMGYVVRFLVRNEYLNQIGLVFPEKMTFQDTVWMPKVIINSPRIQVSSATAYIYWHHESSACGEFDKSYPAKAIFTRSIIVPKQLLDFAEELDARHSVDARYHEYAKVFHDFAQSYYLNKLPLFLSRTSGNERKKFYHILRQKGVPDEVSNIANKLTSLCLHPYMGYVFSSLLSFGYKLKHK